MFYSVLGCLFIVAQFGLQSQAQSANPTVTCYAWGDPHLETWRLVGTPLTGALKQDCYTNGQFNLVKNDYVHFSVQSTSRLITKLTLSLYNPPSKTPICVIKSDEFDLTEKPDCATQDVTVTWSNTVNQNTLTVNYVQGAVNFTTTIQYAANTNNPFYNVYVWAPQSLLATTTGLCTQNDPTCTRTRTFDLVAHSPKQTITFTQAYGICQTYMNAYLNRSQQKRSFLLTNTVDSIMNGCIEDVIFTGDSEIAQSGLNVLMIEELTSGQTSLDSINAAIKYGIKAASMELEDVVKEARIKVARFL